MSAVPTVVLALLLTACSSETPGTPAPTTPPTSVTGTSSAEPTTPDTSTSAPTSTGPPAAAMVTLAGDTRGQRDGSYTVTGSPGADSTCDAGTEQVTVEVENPAPMEGDVEYVFIRAPVAAAPGPGSVSVTFTSEDFGNVYDSDYVAGDGRAGSATAQATVEGSLVTVTFEARNWDGPTMSGTASCTVAS